ncbi:SDR family NAD(P)-dependent oxidoreductase [Aspergillus saccharolyticus JOP 1030-1]|uniref:Short-chain dehydrogenase n=1 Tax=Aspergillus saccharolyticus JOP 1030-1 TaxID=1450539 RepID=A0A318ZUN8_9EURO|nr:short-chain dehydrogenase [Aspergillus saccharolyticus JOP 1030-1]PYH48063.1 short-chain dehydrogenase [Aspergillus saccharolyticus JOP 1030-1]
MTPAKVALVTAGSRGVGAAIARALARDAHLRVAINYHSDQTAANILIQELTTLSSLSRSSTSNFIALQGDMGNRADILRVVAETVDAFGRLDVAVSNAGWTRMTNFMELDDADNEDDWDRCFQMNVKSHFHLFHAVRPHLEATEGAFVATASVAGVQPSGSSLPYAVTKAALIHLVRSLAVIAAPRIRVNSVAPGVLLTDWGRQFSEETLRSVQERNALKRFATPEDVADQVRFLATSPSITGQNIVIDAGFSL